MERFFGKFEQFQQKMPEPFVDPENPEESDMQIYAIWDDIIREALIDLHKYKVAKGQTSDDPSKEESPMVVTKAQFFEIMK